MQQLKESAVRPPELFAIGFSIRTLAKAGLSKPELMECAYLTCTLPYLYPYLGLSKAELIECGGSGQHPRPRPCLSKPHQPWTLS